MIPLRLPVDGSTDSYVVDLVVIYLYDIHDMIICNLRFLLLLTYLTQG